ncbi:MAG: GSCFA domain-containing protein [Prevotellaceae bacterium]|nr:GSCFA domain-containing protein [Prevotellaceae bacterium]
MRKHSTAVAPFPDCDFRTVVPVSRPLRQLGVADRNVFLGSCFADSVGGMFQESRLLSVVNPLGTVYSPASLARLLSEEGSHLQAVEGPDGWHTWLSGTALTRPTSDECLSLTSEALRSLQEKLAEADNLFLTLGTNHVYRLADTGEVVTNCHKHPAREFREEAQSPLQMAEALSEVLSSLHERNPRLLVTFTVSPYRYAKYGFHESQLSKAALLLCVKQLQESHPLWVQYFPAYELLLDELRDYRFYADDMLHPSPQAVRYIWRRLHEWMDIDLLTYLQRWQSTSEALSHRPFRPQSAAARQFAERTEEALRRLQTDYPMLQIITPQ